MKVSKELIESGKSERGGWNRAQILSLGETWPPQVGWKKRAIGREISPLLARTLFRYVEHA